MPLVEPGHRPPEAVLGRPGREHVEVAAAQMPAGMAREGVQRQQRRVDDEDERAQPHPEPPVEPKGEDGVPPQEGEDGQGEPEEVAVDVLEHEGEARLPEIPLGPVAHRAARRRSEERPVVRLAIVIAGGAEPAGDPQDQEGGREVPPGPDQRQGHVLAIGGQARRVERREIRRGVVVGVLQSRPRGVDAEAAEDEHDQELLDPPRVRSERRARDHLAALIAEKRFPHLTRSPSRSALP